jgi:hypothetical protein
MLLALFRPSGVFESAFPLWSTAATGSVCGLNIPCLDAPNIAVILACTVLLYLLILRLLHNRWIAAGSACLWASSLVVLDSVAWQATVLDKLVTLFSLLALHAVISSVRWRRTVLANVVVFVPVLLAYNCK